MTNDETERASNAATDRDAGPAPAGEPPALAAPRAESLTPPPAADAPQPPAANAPRRSRLALPALLLALAALGAAAWSVWEIRRQADALEAGREAVESGLAQMRTALENQASVLEQLARSDDEHVEAGEARAQTLAGLDQRLRAAERGLEDAAGGTDAARRALWRTEIEQYLRMANRAARLARDPQTALAALRIADNRLRALDDPALTAVREALSAEIDSLENLPGIDVDGVALRLGRLAARVDELPLENRPAAERPAAELEAGNEQGFWARGWAAIRGAFSNLVSVRRTDEQVRPLLAPGQAFFLRQNLRLELEVARLAALRGDRTNYAQSLGNAREWLATYFDVTDAATRSALETLDTLARVELETELPDISGSLDALRSAGGQPEAL
jgi:uroporphyrin-3 C-methyltransferase